MRSSIFTRLTLLAIAASLAMALLAALFFRLIVSEVREQYRYNPTHRLLHLAARQIIRNPSPEFINAVAEDLHLDIRYQSPHYTWSTDDDMPPAGSITPFRRAHRAKPFAVMWGRHGGEVYAVVRHPPHAVIFEVEDESVIAAAYFWIGGFIASLAALWVGLYFLVRRMLAPLRTLRAGMDAVGGGKWRDIHLPRDDEMRALAQGFNKMQARVREMLKSKERFLIDASHELRSPIARIKLAAEMLPADDKRAARIKRDIVELEKLTAEILENARAASGRAPMSRQSLEVDGWLRRVAARYESEQRARLDEELSAQGARASIDEEKMTRALVNLVDNGLKYAGRVRVQSGVDENHIVIRIHDNGAGVAADDLPNLFLPFYRADTARARDTGGYGLGLAISAEIVRAHGGEIFAENGEGGGLAVVVRLPMLTAQTAAAGESENKNEDEN